MQAAAKSNLAAVSAEYFADVDTQGATVEAIFEPRSWADILKCRQRFAMLLQPAPMKGQSLVVVHAFAATPIDVRESREPVLETREMR
jgi:hypothetical protein